jgi:hypothetical protein
LTRSSATRIASSVFGFLGLAVGDDLTRGEDRRPKRPTARQSQDQGTAGHDALAARYIASALVVKSAEAMNETQ